MRLFVPHVILYIMFLLSYSGEGEKVFVVWFDS